MSDSIPKDLRYTKEHEWARRDGDLVVVGVTQHAVDQLGDITMVSLPSEGDEVTEGDSFGDIDSVKAVSELFAPISGVVAAVNEGLEDEPEKVNQDPYGDGWLVKLKPADESQLDALLDAGAYEELVAED